MKRELLSILIAAGFVAVIFLVNYAIKRDEGVAYASAGGSMSREILNGENISTARKREIRQAVSANPKNLIDISGREIYSVMAGPELVRIDAPTIVWQYRNDFCVLDIYFTTQEQTPLRAPAVHYEIRAREKGVPDEAVQSRCVRDLVRARAGGNLVNVNALYKAN